MHFTKSLTENEKTFSDCHVFAFLLKIFSTHILEMLVSIAVTRSMILQVYKLIDCLICLIQSNSIYGLKITLMRFTAFPVLQECFNSFVC